MAKTRKVSAWNKHVQAVYKKYHGKKPFSQCLVEASKSYHKKGSGGWSLPKASVGLDIGSFSW